MPSSCCPPRETLYSMDWYKIVCSCSVAFIDRVAGPLEMLPSLAATDPFKCCSHESDFCESYIQHLFCFAMSVWAFNFAVQKPVGRRYLRPLSVHPNHRKHPPHMQNHRRKKSVGRVSPLAFSRLVMPTETLGPLLVFPGATSPLLAISTGGKRSGEIRPSTRPRHNP